MAAATDVDARGTVDGTFTSYFVAAGSYVLRPAIASGQDGDLWLPVEVDNVFSIARVDGT